MKVCPNCKIAYDDRYGFCKKCGQKLETHIEQNLRHSQNSTSNEGLGNNTGNKNDSKKWIIIIGSLVSIALVGFFALSNNLFTNKNVPTNTSDKSNLQQEYKQNSISSVDNKKNVSILNKRGGIITGTEVLMRSGPGKQYKNVGVFEQGETVEIVEEQQGWFKVQTANLNNAVWVFKPYCSEYIGDRQMPDKIILHQAIDGEAMVDILKCTVSPKVNLKVYEKPDESSNVIDTLSAGNFYSIIDFELHTYPINNVYTTKTGEAVRLLSYRGEGYYSIFRNGIIREVEMQTNRLELKRWPDFWLCLKVSGDKYGWLMFKSREDWNISKQHTGIFFESNYR